jgi:hypothetical protein
MRLQPKRILHRLGFFEAVLAFGLFLSSAKAATLASNGSSADVQAKINAATDGDTVTIPVGTFTWTSSVRVTKAVYLKGLGTAGKILGRSATAVAVGTGTKTFTVDAGLDITAGQTLRIWKTGGDINPSTAASLGTWPWVEGTVTSYTGTSLVMNITSTNGSGTVRPWHITTPATTTIVNNVGSPGNLIEVAGPFSRSAEISNIRFEHGTGTGEYIILNPTGYPTLVHDCFFTIHGAGGCIYSRTNQGVVWNTYFVDRNWTRAPLAFKHKFYNTNASWETASTMGTEDTTGTSNFYFEDCWFVGFLNATDFDDNSRAVIRRSFFDHSGIGTHGADTGDPAIGVRHYEVYDNVFYFDNIGTETIPLTWWFYLRGGTGVIYNNTLPAISSGQWGTPLMINMTIQNLGRQGSANGFGCWGYNNPGSQYPAPRQIGRGNSDGTASNTDPKGLTVMGNLEPLYVWGNTTTPLMGVTDYRYNDTGACPCSSQTDFLAKQDDAADYIVAGRDYYNNGTAKPGWSRPPSGHPAAYPHSLRGAPRFVEIQVAVVP